MLQGSFQRAVDQFAVEKRRRGAGDPGPDATLEVAAHPRGNRRRAPVSVEPLQVEFLLPDPLPQMGVVDPALVGIDGIDEKPEGALPALAGDRLGGCVERRCARMLTGDREVAKDEPEVQVLQPSPGRGAMRAGEIGIEKDFASVPAHVVVGSRRRNAGACELSLGQTR